MKRLYDLVEERSHRRRYPDFQQCGIVDVSCEKTGATKPNTISYNEEHALSARIVVTFWANPAQYRTCKLMAEQHLISVLYGGALAYIDRARSAIAGDDKSAALDALNELRNHLIG